LFFEVGFQERWHFLYFIGCTQGLEGIIRAGNVLSACHPRENDQRWHAENGLRACHPSGNVQRWHAENGLRACHPRGNDQRWHAE